MRLSGFVLTEETRRERAVPYEFVRGEHRPVPFEYSSSTLEMLLLPGGRERTAEEFGALLARGGFALSRVVPTESPLSVTEARPQ